MPQNWRGLKIARNESQREGKKGLDMDLITTVKVRSKKNNKNEKKKSWDIQTL